MAKHRRKSTIGANPLDRLGNFRRKGGKKSLLKDDPKTAEIKEALLKKTAPEQSTLKRWFKSLLG